LIGSHLEEAVESQKLTYTVHMTYYKAVTCKKRQSRLRKWRQVTSGDRKWRRLTETHMEVAVEGQKLTYTVNFTMYKAVAQ